MNQIMVVSKLNQIVVDLYILHVEFLIFYLIRFCVFWNIEFKVISTNYIMLLSRAFYLQEEVKLPFLKL